MQFISTNAEALYFVTHGEREYVGPGKTPITHRGITVQFAGPERRGVFDSEEAQRKYRWSDEKREEVEEYLRSHPDFGVTMFAPSELGDEVKATTCSFGIPTAEGFELCGDEATEGPYCAGHAEQIRSALAKEEKTKVKAGAK